MNNWKHLSEKVKRHVKCSSHVENCLKVALFGKTNIAEQLSFRYVERLWSFCNLPQGNAENISANVISYFWIVFFLLLMTSKNLLHNVMMVPQ